jgi:hypothetical protein
MAFMERCIPPASERRRFKKSHLEGFSEWTRHTRASSLADILAQRDGLPAVGWRRRI